MRAARWLHFRHGFGAIAAALIAAAISFTAIGDSRAQNPPPDKRAQKKPPAKPVVRAPIRGAIKGPVLPNRNVITPGARPFPRGPLPGLPQNARTIPNGVNPNAVNPNLRGPGGFAARDPRTPGKRFTPGPGMPK